MAVIETTTNENGDAILISLQEPYKNVVEVLSYSDDVTGESTSLYFSKHFRWGIDGVTYSDWIVCYSNCNLAPLSAEQCFYYWSR